MSGALAVYACCVVVLFFKMLAISCYQGYFRLRFLTFTNSEDAAVFKRSACPEELPQVTRAMQGRVAEARAAALAVVLEAPVAMTAWLSGAFTVARVSHTVTYLAGIQPWRTVSYGVGVICLIGLATLVIDALASTP